MSLNHRFRTFGTVVSIAALSALGTGTVSADLITFSKGGIDGSYLGKDCIAATCVDLESAGYTVDGGGVVDPAGNEGGKYLTPGWDTFAEANKTASYNVTSVAGQTDPDGAGTKIVISDLDGAFDFYWGSVDSYNVVTFFVGGGTVEFTGTDLANLLNKNNGGRNYRFDAYVSFAGDFSKVELSSFDGAAFELATAVPEPGTLALLGLGLMGIGFARRRAST